MAPLGPSASRTWHGVAGRCGVAVAGVGPAGPVVAGNQALVAAFDGRIDNRPELAARLGQAYQRLTDPELFLAAYEKWGDEALAQVVGPFAVAIVDTRRGGVLLARDHLGQRPLVLAEVGRSIGFASNALALAALEGVGCNLDEVHAAEILALAYNTERTFVRGIRWVRPGEAIWLSADGPERRYWWTPDRETRDAVDHAGALRMALDDAVAAASRGCTSLGAQLSGGLDSSSVAATAALLLEGQLLPTYTATPPPSWDGPVSLGWEAREESYVADLARTHTNIRPRFVEVSGRPLVEGRYERYWALGAGVPRNPCNFIWVEAIAEAAAREGVDVLLTGAVGNLAYSADGPGWLWELVRAGRPLEALHEARGWSGRAGGSLLRTARRYVLPPALPAPARRVIAALASRGPLYDRLEECAVHPSVARDIDLARLYPQLDRSLATPHREGLLASIADLAGQADTAAATDCVWGVEHRDPTADRRVWNAALAQPEWARRRAGVARAAIREAMSDRLPSSVLHRETLGAQLPDWLDRMTDARAEIRSELQLMRDHARSTELIDVERLERLEACWPPPASCADPHVTRSYRGALLRGMVVSRYLRWFDEQRGTRTRPPTRSTAAVRH